MDHEWFQTRLMELEDNELPEDEREQLLGHLKACPSCRADMERWGQTRKALSTLGKGHFPEGPFVGRVMEEIHRVPEKHSLWRSLFGLIPEWIYPELGLATAAVALFFVLSIFQQSSVSVETLLLGWSPADMQWLSETPSPATEALFGEGEV